MAFRDRLPLRQPAVREHRLLPMRLTTYADLQPGGGRGVSHQTIVKRDPVGGWAP